ncbi:hypothetical protein DIPPA_29626 [Diplonema papillatum]|nr:hypothetical protein DIPPA_29626 [Diplonema papillatum]
MPARCLTALLLLLAVVAGSDTAEYAALCEKLLEAAQKAGEHFKGGRAKKAEAAMKRAKAAFESAAPLSKQLGDPEAYITYATLLLNANRLEESFGVWTEAKQHVGDAVKAANPHVIEFINARARKCRYGIVSMEKDAAYAAGSGDIAETLRLQAEQLRLRPLPQIYYDRATARVMASGGAPENVSLAVGDFKTAQAEAVRGYLAGKPLLGKRCNAESSSLAEFPATGSAASAEGRRVGSTHVSDFHMHEDRAGGTTFDSTVRGSRREALHLAPVPFVSTMSGASVVGPDALVVKDACPVDRWTLKALTAELTKFYELARETGRARQAKDILKTFAHQPDVLRSALVKKYTGARGLAEDSFKWLDDWVEDYGKGCSCVVYQPSQRWRVDYGRNLPIVDVYGEFPEKSPAGQLQWIVSPRQTQATIPEAYLVTGFAGASFYHFVAEVLPRVVMVLEEKRSFTDVALLVPEDSSKNRFVSAFLSLLSLPSGLIVRPYTGELAVKTLHIPTWIPETDDPNCIAPPQLLQKVRTLLSEDSRTPVRDTVVYLSRKDTSMRKLVDDDAVFSSVARVAAAKGLRAVRFASPLSSIEETRGVFRDAVAVVGVHGGAFANTIFCTPGTVIVELGFASVFSHDYVRMSAALGLEHHLYLLDESPNGFGAGHVVLSDKEAFAAVLSAVIPQGATKDGEEL